MKKILILIHPHNDGAINFATSLVEPCIKMNSEVYLVRENLVKIYTHNSKTDWHKESKEFINNLIVDHIVVLGGDGLFLKAVNIAKNSKNTLISSINFGSLGFLSDNSFAKTQLIAEEIYSTPTKEKFVSNIPLNHFELMINDEKEYDNAWFLNEVYIGKNHKNETTYFTLYVNDKKLISWKADALIVSSSIGSTAYSLSVFGPIIWPDVNVLMVLPIHPHNILNRPLIINKKSKLMVETNFIKNKLYVSCDGNNEYYFSKNLRFVFSPHQHFVRVIDRKSYSFEEKLRNRFLHEYL